MRTSRFLEMMQLVGFDAADAELLRGMTPEVAPFFPRIVRRFYEALLSEPEVRAIFTGGDEQIKKLHDVLNTWLEELFRGPYDDAYHAKRLAIGASHVRVGLPQHYMILGIELIRAELKQALRTAGITDLHRKLDALDKLLTLDLTTMLESYKDAYGERIRRTERDALEEKLTRAEHLAEIGQLAASLAHEIKNPLAGISGAIQIIGEGMAPDNPHRQIVEEILGQIRRLDAAVKDLLVYGRPVRPDVGQLELRDVVARVLILLQKEPEVQRVRIAYDPPTADATVCADEAHIEQLLINLIINAAHASDEGQSVQVELATDADHVRLIVADSGKGMTPKVQRRAFEPFFTTKAKGTGLGLAICRRLMEATGGTVQLDSQLGKGTTVVANIPRTVSIPEDSAIQ